jgi:hypothetical protein
MPESQAGDMSPGDEAEGEPKLADSRIELKNVPNCETRRGFVSHYTEFAFPEQTPKNRCRRGAQSCSQKKV